MSFHEVHGSLYGQDRGNFVIIILSILNQMKIRGLWDFRLIIWQYNDAGWVPPILLFCLLQISCLKHHHFAGFSELENQENSFTLVFPLFFCSPVRKCAFWLLLVILYYPIETGKWKKKKKFLCTTCQRRILVLNYSHENNFSVLFGRTHKFDVLEC